MVGIVQTTFSNVFFLKENVRIAINISLDFVPKGPINNIPGLVEITAWHRTGDRALCEPIMARLPTHICVTRAPMSWISDMACCIYWSSIMPVVNWGYSAGVFQTSLLVAVVVSYVPCILVQNHFILFTYLDIYAYIYLSLFRFRPFWIESHASSFYRRSLNISIKLNGS